MGVFSRKKVTEDVPVEVVELYGMDEFAVLTREMTEGEMKAAVSGYNAAEAERSEYGVKQTIRAMV